MERAGQTETGLQALVDNPLELNEQGVYECADAEPIAYSDGRDSELYLHKVFAECSDLGSDSAELQARIRDWPSEYHLSARRGQLFSCFEFNRSARVLEVGCGCGAITRYLGENFDSVVSVEGARPRAAVARERCRDLDSVQILCAPFQEVRFKECFDLIICVGVFEYSRAFVDGEDPYAEIVRYFAGQLRDNGVLLLAIENQFGLKYFASASEDHTGVPYDGLEGYHRHADKGRTFGREQLATYLQPHFPTQEFLFPFPDYKVPDAVFSEQLFDQVDASPLLAQTSSRDYLRPLRASFDERLAWKELARNDAVPFFAHSFLVLASRTGEQPWVSVRDLAVVHKRNRARQYQTRTRILPGQLPGRPVVDKQLMYPTEQTGKSYVLKGYQEDWVEGKTVHQQVLELAMLRGSDLRLIFEPARDWAQALSREARDGMLPGNRLDAIWQNSFSQGNENRYIDLEWHSSEPVPLAQVVVRAIYWFLVDARAYPSMARELRRRSTRDLVLVVSEELGVAVSPREIAEFARFESSFRADALGRSPALSRLHVSLALGLSQRTLRAALAMTGLVSIAGFYARRALRIARRLYHGARSR